MNSTSSKVIIAVVAAALGLGAVAPAMAQSAPPAPEAAVTQADNGHTFRPQGGGPRHRGGEAGFLDFGRGAEAVEVALVKLSHRIDLTTEQQGLLDTLKTSALAAADDFATATEGLRPTPPVEGADKVIPSVSERLETRIAVEKAHVAALEAVQPAVVAFFDSLTDEQAAELAPQGERGPGPRGQHGGEHPQGPRGQGGNR